MTHRSAPLQHLPMPALTDVDVRVLAEAGGIQGADQGGKAGGTGLILMDVPGQPGDGPPGLRIGGACTGLVQFDDILSAPLCAAAAVLFCQLDIGDIRGTESHQGTAIGIQLHGVSAQIHAVGFYGCAAFLKVKIPADAVNHDQPGL